MVECNHNTSTCNGRNLKTLAVSVAEQTGLSRTWSKPPKAYFLVTCPFIHVSACGCARAYVCVSVCWCINMYTRRFVFSLVPLRFVKYQSLRVISISRNGTEPNKNKDKHPLSLISAFDVHYIATCYSRNFKTLASLCS